MKLKKRIREIRESNGDRSRDAIVWVHENVAQTRLWRVVQARFGFVIGSSGSRSAPLGAFNEGGTRSR